MNTEQRTFLTNANVSMTDSNGLHNRILVNAYQDFEREQLNKSRSPWMVYHSVLLVEEAAVGAEEL